MKIVLANKSCTDSSPFKSNYVVPSAKNSSILRKNNFSVGRIKSAFSVYSSGSSSQQHYFPVFKGLWFENNIVRQVDGKKYQGNGLYKPNSGFIDFNKVGWENLSKEPLDITKASDKEIYAFYHANALAETNDSTWVRRYNKYNVTKPLATFHTLNSQKSKQTFLEHLKELHDKSYHTTLDVPITDENGKLIIDCSVFDTETTGTNISDKSKPLDKIIQIGAIQVKKGQVIEDTAFSQYVNPECHVPEGATAVHGITDEMLVDKPKIEAVLKPFLNDYLNKKNGIIVAYNSKFDMTLLNNAIKEHNSFSHEPLKERRTCKVLDPFILIQRIHPYLGARKKLGEQYKFLFCKNLDNAHDAFSDVKGTVDVLKYSLYYLSEHRKDKSKPLSLREVLVFQNGGKVDNIDLPLDKEGCNARVNFDKSYSQVALAVDNYFEGYKLTPKILDEIKPVIGEENTAKLKREKVENKLVSLAANTELPINPCETEMLSEGKGVENSFYVIEKNFKKVLGFANLTPYGNLSKEEIVDFIAEKSKKYLNESSVDVWMKNPNPADIKDGNDLPDINIARRVMMESTSSSNLL